MSGILPFGRPTVYNGVLMRSRLEAWHAAWFDQHEMVWEYEPVAFADAGGQYLPDFRITLGDVRVYCEIKGVVEDPVPFMERAEIIWSSEPRARLTLVEGHYDNYWFTRPSSEADGFIEWALYDAFGDHWPVRSLELP